MEKYIYANELKHFGRKGMKWYQNVYSKETVNAKKQAGESKVPNKVKRNVDEIVTNMDHDKALASRNRLTTYLKAAAPQLKRRTGKEKWIAVARTSVLLAAALGIKLARNTNARKSFNDISKKYLK